MRVTDLPELLAWERYTNPLLQDYNLPFSSLESGRRWLRGRQQSRWPYSIRNDESVLVGHLSLRHIKRGESSRLGIGFGAQHVAHGYGLDAMCVYLDYYFGLLGFEQMVLDVCAANLRAWHLYRKLGFKELWSFWQRVPEGVVRTKETNAHFRHRRIRFFEMRLLATEWQGARAFLG